VFEASCVEYTAHGTHFLESWNSAASSDGRRKDPRQKTTATLRVAPNPVNLLNNSRLVSAAPLVVVLHLAGSALRLYESWLTRRSGEKR
jgi:hypothetical protein